MIEKLRSRETGTSVMERPGKGMLKSESVEAESESKARNLNLS